MLHLSVIAVGMSSSLINTLHQTCKEKFNECSEKFVTKILFNLYRRHHTTLQILETQVIGNKYKKLANWGTKKFLCK
jgi:hypothetical protein